MKRVRIQLALLLLLLYTCYINNVRHDMLVNCFQIIRSSTRYNNNRHVGVIPSEYFTKIRRFFQPNECNQFD